MIKEDATIEYYSKLVKSAEADEAEMIRKQYCDCAKTQNVHKNISQYT